MADVQSLSLRRGANAMMVLIDKIRTISNETCETWDDYEAGGPPPPDTRDYAAILAVVEAALRRHLDHPDNEQRQGFLRALVDLLCIGTDGTYPDFRDWDPIKNTAHAFSQGAAHG